MSSSEDASRTELEGMFRPVVERTRTLQAELVSDLLNGYDELASEREGADSAPRLRIVASKRSQTNYGLMSSAADDRAKGCTNPAPFQTPHERLLADTLVDVLIASRVPMLLSSHGHEEGLLLAELRHFRGMQRAAREAARRGPSRLGKAQLSGVAAGDASSAVAHPFGLRVPAPLPSSHFFDLSGIGYLPGLRRNEEMHRQVLAYAALYEPVVKVAVDPAKGQEVRSHLVSHLAEEFKGVDPHMVLPPLLLAAPPPPPVFVRKNVRSNVVRFVIVAGAEGTGHHFVDSVLATTRHFNTTGQYATQRRQNSAGASLEQKDKSPQSLISMRHNGRVVYPQLRSDAHLSNFCYAMFAHDSMAAYERAKRQLVIRLKWLLGLMTGATRLPEDDQPAVFFINMLNSGGDGMMSYPNNDGPDRSMHHPDLIGLAKVFESCGADLRVLTLVRSPGASFQSTIRRGHGDGLKVHRGTDVNFMFQARALHDNLAVLDADLRGLDPAFKLNMQLETMVREPHRSAKEISLHTGLHEDSLLYALVMVGTTFHVKEASSWKLTMNLAQAALTREHFAHVSSLSLSDGMQYVDGLINPEARLARGYVWANRMAHLQRSPALLTSGKKEDDEEEKKQLALRVAADNLLTHPTDDQRDSDVQHSVCVALSSLTPLLNRAERHTLPLRVALRSLEGSGSSFLRWGLEQLTGLLTGSVDGHDLTPWPLSAFVPWSLISQFKSWSSSGQTIVETNDTCISCHFDVSWGKDAYYKPNFRVEYKPDKEILATALNEPRSAESMKLKQEQLYADKWSQALAHNRTLGPADVPPWVAPLGGQVVLLRNPLFVAISLAHHYVLNHPFFANSDRFTAMDDRSDEWVRRALDFMREHAVKESLRLVADWYPSFLNQTGILPPDFFAALEEGKPPSPEFFEDTAWGSSSFAPARPEGAPHPVPTYVLHYEELELEPLANLKSLLQFLGLESHPRHEACLAEVLKNMQFARPGPKNSPWGSDPLALFAHSLTASTSRFVERFPWEWHLLLPKVEFLAFVRRIEPFAHFFGYMPSLQALRAAAEPRWEDEANYVLKHGGKIDAPGAADIRLQSAMMHAEERRNQVREHERMASEAAKQQTSLPSHVLRQRQIFLEQQRALRGRVGAGGPAANNQKKKKTKKSSSASATRQRTTQLP